MTELEEKEKLWRDIVHIAVTITQEKKGLWLLISPWFLFNF